MIKILEIEIANLLNIIIFALKKKISNGKPN